MIQRAVWRFARTAIAVGVGAALVWAADNVGDLSIDPAFAVLIGAVLTALGKWLRDNGWSDKLPV